MGLYCFVNFIFRDTSASFQFVVLLIREIDVVASPAPCSDAVLKLRQIFYVAADDECT